LYFASGGSPGFTPPFKTPDFIISSNDLACTLNESDKKIIRAKIDLNILLIMFPLLFIYTKFNYKQKFTYTVNFTVM
jgi:hypothetical protein